MQLRDQLSLVESELAGIKKSYSYRLSQAIHGSSFGRLILKLFDSLIVPYRAFRLRLDDIRSVPAGQIRITALNQHNPESEGNEVWLLDVISANSASAYDLSQARRTGSWEMRRNIDSQSNLCLITPGNGRVQMIAGVGDRLNFLAHPNSGMAEINWQGQKSTIDLFSFPAGRLIVELGSAGFTAQFIAEKPLPGQEPPQAKEILCSRMSPQYGMAFAPLSSFAGQGSFISGVLAKKEWLRSWLLQGFAPAF